MTGPVRSGGVGRRPATVWALTVTLLTGTVLVAPTVPVAPEPSAAVGAVSSAAPTEAPARPGGAQRPAAVSDVRWADDLPPGWPSLDAAGLDAAVVVDARTGQVLGERGADRDRPVASTVKMLTALTVLRRVRPGEVVTVGDEVRGVGGASVGLRPGDRWTVRQLLEGLLIRSGNDAATALAVHVSGSVGAFVAAMQREARRLRVGVQLATPSGLEDRNLLSASDLAVIARVARRHPVIRDIVGRRTVELPGIGVVANRNGLLASYTGADGIKTGFTTRAGWSLVASAERDGVELVAVALGAETESQRDAATARLLDHGFERFERRPGRARQRLIGGGRDLVVAVHTVAIGTPVGSPRARAVLRVPVEFADAPRSVPIRWGRHALGTTSTRLVPGSAEPVEGGAVLGRWVADRAYAAMRAASRAGAWPAVERDALGSGGG